MPIQYAKKNPLQKPTQKHNTQFVILKTSSQNNQFFKENPRFFFLVMHQQTLHNTQKKKKTFLYPIGFSKKIIQKHTQVFTTP
jgi:hypothetical protein